MRYKYFLFDWDGSLGATLPLWFETFKMVFKEYGKEVSFLEIGREVIGDWDGPKKFGVFNQEKFFGRMEELILGKLENVKLNEGARELLNNIKSEGGKISVVTTSRRVYVEKALKNNGIFEMVDVFLSKEDVRLYKPNPEIIYKAIEKMKGTTEESVVIGDTEKDVMAAKNAGVDSVLYYPESYQIFYDKDFQESLDATYLISRFSDLERVVNKNPANERG